MAQLSDLTAAVAANTSAAGSIIQLVEGLAAKYEGAKNDPVEIQRLVDESRSTTQGMVDSVFAHTPVDPTV